MSIKYHVLAVMAVASMVFVTGCQTTQTSDASLKCIAHTLSPGNDNVAAPGVFFNVRNIGPKPVVIVTNGGVIITLNDGEETRFIGDNRFAYSIKLVAPGDTTTIEFCE